MEVRVAAVSSDFAGMSLRFLNDADEAGFSLYLADEWAFGIQEKSTDLGSGSLPYEQTHFYVIRIEDGEITLSAATGNYSDTGGSVVATLEKTLTTSGTVKKIVLGVSGDSTKSAGASDLQVTRLCP